MELIRYRKTLDVHKNGSQFMLQGFQTADNMSRVIEISLMASGDAIDFPLEKVEALMYVTTPNATEPSINECTIKDNKVVYDVLPIVEEGITTMQLKIIETSTEGATGILACPKFSVEVTKSGVDDGKAEQTTTYTALENAMAKAKAVYDERFLRMELTSDCIFKAYYADGTVYETDLLKKLFLNGNVLLSESFAHGGTGVRAGEDTDNSMYYSNVSKSEALNAKNIMENSEEILEEVKLHGVYTAFNVDFETGEVEYVSPSFKFKIDLESGELDVIGQNYTFDNEVGRIVEEWLLANKIVLSDLQDIATTHTTKIGELKNTTKTHTDEIADLKKLKTRVTPIEFGGTGADNADDATENLKILLPETKATLGLPETATPDDAFNGLFNKLATQNMNKLVIQKIKASGTWTVPKALNQTFKVFVVGGGGGGGNGGGGGGHIVIRDIILNEGEEIDVVCGAGGTGYIYNNTDIPPTDGGTTTFGDISADGGSAGGMSNFTTAKAGHGGAGGAGGGGAGWFRCIYSSDSKTTHIAGDGGDASFGGGGGGGHSLWYYGDWAVGNYGDSIEANQGNGGSAGLYGGRGGSPKTTLSCKAVFNDISIVDMLLKWDEQPDNAIEQTELTCGEGSMYGGPGGKPNKSYDNATGSGGGGGGFCASGAQGGLGAGGAGGAGYFGNGGRPSSQYGNTNGKGSWTCGGGGGGGFFCNGGDGGNENGSYRHCGGGGGGFFDDGKVGKSHWQSGAHGGNGGVLIMYIKED